MRLSKLILFLTASALIAQQPIGITQVGISQTNTGDQIDYHAFSGTPGGDTYRWTAWAAASMLHFFPTNSVGSLPIVGAWNDGSAGICSGNIGLVQLTKLPALGVTATSGNTLITPMASCWGNGTVDATWTDGLSWKGAPTAFRNSILIAPWYRQSHDGSTYGVSTTAVSFDAAQTWVDYGRWQGYTVTAASCTGGVATLTLTSTSGLSNGNAVWVHNVGAGYDSVPGQSAMSTITVSGSTISYSATCPGTTPSSGYVALLDAAGSEPWGAGSGSYNMMWPLDGSGHNNMAVRLDLNYGQDGSYPAGINPSCDPTVWNCFIASDYTQSSAPVYLGRHPIATPLDKTSYQWYYCPGYSEWFPVESTVCDGTRAGAWTNTQANATPIFHSGYGANRTGYLLLGQEAMTYIPAFSSYLMPGGLRDSIGGLNRIAWIWSPQPWGPFYQVSASTCGETGIVCGPGFNSILPIGTITTSTTPPAARLRYSSDTFNYGGGGNPVFGEIGVTLGRGPGTGMARQATYVNVGQANIGHRFTSGQMAGAISRRGPGYSLTWWMDGWDHGGNTFEYNRTNLRDVSGTPNVFSGFLVGGNLINGEAFANNGFQLLPPSGADTPRLTSSLTDNTVSANSGNASWSTVIIFDVTSATGTGVQNHFGRPIPVFRTGAQLANTTGVQIEVGRVAAGDITISWGDYTGSTNPVMFSTAGGVISANTMYTLSVTVSANGSGLPTVTMYLSSAGTTTVYGGVNMALSADGTTGGGLTKHCTGATCTTTPAVTATVVTLGSDGFQEQLNGVFAEIGLYSGVLPEHIVRSIYRTLKTDWARVNRGTL